MFVAASLLLCTFAGAMDQDSQAPDTSPPSLLETVVAKVGILEIDLADVKAEVNRIVPLEFFHARLPEDQKEETYRKALDSLIEKGLIQQDAMERGIEIEEQAMRAEFHRTLTKAGAQYADIQEDEFLQLLEQYRPMVERRLLIDRNEARFQETLPKIGEAEVQQRYQELKDDLVSPQEARFLHIMAKVAPSAGQAEAMVVRDELKKLRTRIEQGESFAELAKRFSDDIYSSQGGDMGFIAEGAFQISELNKAAFALKDGEMSEVLTSLYGFHLLRRIETRPARKLSLEEAAPILRATLEEETQFAAREAWISSMKESIGVEILIDLNQNILPSQDTTTH